MLLNKIITIKPYGKSIKYYREYFNKEIKTGEELVLEVKDVLKTSGEKIPYICDYCGREVWVSAKDYYKKHKNDTEDYISKDACNCSTCMARKREDNYLHKTGYKTPLNNPEVREKGRQTFLEKYGTDNFLSSDEYKEKMDEYLKEHNVDNVMQIPEVLEKLQNTMLERYGSKTNLTMEEGKEERRLKAVISRAEHNNYPSSKNQEKLQTIIGGELNKPIGYYCVDIGFIKDKIYVEYDGSGHDLEVKKGLITRKEFMRRAIIRYFYLKKLGFKKLTFVNSKEHKLPSNNTILALKDYGFKILSQENYNWIEFNFDTKEVKTKFWTKNYKTELNLK